MKCQLEGRPISIVEPYIWALPVWGGGLNACPHGLGHLFREELSKFKWANPCFLGGLNACPDPSLIEPKLITVTFILLSQMRNVALIMFYTNNDLYSEVEGEARQTR